MEDNIANALKMAAAVLMFIVALSISISSFGHVRKTAQTIIELNDREYNYTYVGNANTTKRIVGPETIIPSIYRAYVENYKIFFYDKNGEKVALYTKHEMNSEGRYEDVVKNYIDLEKETLRDNLVKENFIKGILYGEDALNKEYKDFFELRGIKFFTKGLNHDKIYKVLCDIIDKNNGKRFEESLGEYYQEDLVEEVDGDGSNADSVPETNKTKKRIISYKVINE